MPFTDPMADGPSIQAAGLRALKAGMTLKKTLEMVRGFRKDDDATPLVLMGYYNPIYIYGVDKFLVDAKTAGVDGLIIVDLPPEEDTELCLPAMKAGLNFIRLATPTTDDKRLPAVLANTSGFVYYVSITGITGSASADSNVVGEAVARIKRHTKLPVCVGFGIRTPEAARAIAENANGAVVGTALVDALRGSLDAEGRATAKTVDRRRRSGRRAGAGRAGRETGRGISHNCVEYGVEVGGLPGLPAPGRHIFQLMRLNRISERNMNWLTNVVRPKIRNILRRETPENLWIKCPDSGQLVFYKDVEANQFVIPGSNYHMRMGAVARLKSIFDNETWYDIALPEVTADPLKFRDERKYVDRIKDARAKTGLNDAIKVGYGKLEGAGVVDRGAGFRFHGRLARHGRGRSDRARARARGRKEIALHRVRGLRRRADAGRHPVADADAAHHRRRADAARSEAALHRGADQSDHRRRHRVLRDARRRADRRARRADRLCRRARDRADHSRETAGRFPARRISARPRHGRHGGASPRDAPDAGAAVPAADQVAGARGRLQSLRRRSPTRPRSSRRRKRCRPRPTRERACRQTAAARSN